MSWIAGISYIPLNVFGFQACEDVSSRTRLQQFTNVSNGLSYVFGPAIAVIRLLAALFLGLSIIAYSRNEPSYERKAADITVAKKYVGWLVLRVLADCVGPFSAIFDWKAMKQREEQTCYISMEEDDSDIN